MSNPFDSNFRVGAGRADETPHGHTSAPRAHTPRPGAPAPQTRTPHGRATAQPHPHAAAPAAGAAMGRPHSTGARPAEGTRTNRPARNAARGHHPQGGMPQAAAATTRDGRPRSRYIPALDGIRTFAVIAVVLYHLNLTWAQGGLLGVTVFFVLSGYLITRLLLEEFRGTGRIDLKSFWIRRVRRLLPAIVTVIVVTCVLCTVFNHVMLTKMRPDIVPSLLFFNNWWQIIRNVSYFDALGDPSPLTHFWSLAIEEQFYLVWPPILLLLLKLGVKRKPLRRVVAVLAAVSALAMALMYNPAVDPSRIYYGTDTRVFSLLLGAWLAFIPERSMSPRALLDTIGLGRFLPARDADDGGAVHAAPGSRGAAGRLGGVFSGTLGCDIVGAIGLIGLVLMVVFTNGYTAFQYQGGTLLATIFTLMLMMAAVQPDSVIARVFSLSPLVWLGKRSYGIYLWHYPLLLLMNPVADVTDTPWWLMIIQALVVVAAAELSYRFIETPFRKGAFGAFVAELRSGATSIPAFARTHIVPVAVCGALVLVAAGGIAFVPDTSALSAEGAALLADDGAAGQTDGATGEDAATDAAADANSGEDGSAATDAEADAGNEAATTEEGFPAGSYDLIMVGDSVSLRCVDIFPSVFPHGHIDAAKSRQFSAGIETYRSYVNQNLAGKVAVFALGTNGLVTDEQIDELMGIVGSNRVAVFVNTRSPQPWVGATNEAIARAADRYDNVSVIDWYGYSANRNDVFDGDGTHLNAKGANEYLNLVYEAVKADLPLHPEDHVDDPQPTAVRNALNTFVQALASGFAPHVINPQEGAGSAA